MDKKIIDAFIYLASCARIPAHEQENLLDMICEHEYEIRTGYNRKWERCKHCDKLRNITSLTNEYIGEV